MIEHKFKTWFPDTKHMTEPWDFEDIARDYSCGMLVDEIESGSLIGEFDEDAPESYKNCIIRQFTGRKDKNGIEIYDGDIIRLGAADCFYVEFMCAAYLLCWKDEMFIHRDKMLANYTSREMEIIGNIYENPDLVDYSKKDL